MVSGGYECGKKRRSSGGGNNGGGKIRDIYATMFKMHHLLPDEVGRQDPRILFDMLDALSGGGAEAYTGSDPYLRMFYGM